MRSFIILVCALSLGGCCWLAKRDCFPPCPPEKVVVVEKSCELPPPITLPTVTMTSEGCPKDWVCFDRENAAKLANRLNSMYTWIIDARTRCGTPTSIPSPR